jgi:hypothetical protein
MPIRPEEPVMHTIEIAGRPTIVVNGSKDEVENLLTDDWLRQDLLVLETEARPLWFGQQKDFFVRPAFQEEAARWEVALSRSLLKGDVREDGREYPCPRFPGITRATTVSRQGAGRLLGGGYENMLQFDRGLRRDG